MNELSRYLILNFTIQNAGGKLISYFEVNFCFIVHFKVKKGRTKTLLKSL